MRSTPTIWIVHRHPGHRAALARLAAAGDDTLLGGPTDELFESAAAPETVLLGVSSDFELELNFVHRVSRRLGDCRWILLGEAGDLPELERLFDSLNAEFLPFPPSPSALPRAIAAAARRRSAEPLSRRQGREQLSDRFARWFRGLDMPDLMRALDPSLARVPLLARGEPGTGRGLIARYAHAFGPTAGGRLAHVSCKGLRRSQDLLEQIADASAAEPRAVGSIWLQDADLLPVALQHRLLDWIEFGLPEGCVHSENLRWLATAGDGATAGPELDPALADAFAGLTLRIPPVRQRPYTVEAFVADTALAWCRARGERTRRFSDEAIAQLEQYPWPGNLRELESVVARTLARCSSDPVLPVHLDFDEVARATTSPEGVEAGPNFAPRGVPPLGRRESAATRAPGEPESTAATAAGRGDRERAHAARPATASVDDVWGRIVSAVAHEVRNPLVSIRTFSELMAENFDDEEFRERFTTLVGTDVRRIEDVVARLEDLLESPGGPPEPVNVAAVLEELLDERYQEIQSRRLLVLKELDRSQPYALGRPEPLRRALAAVLGKALSLVPERGDVYLASKHHSSGLRGRAAVRILLRYHNGDAGDSPVAGPATRGFAPEDLSLRETVLEYAVAEAIVRAQDGTMTVDNTDAQETLVVIDLPAPS
jgi:DNA-binding NtrC family response regulator